MAKQKDTQKQFIQTDLNKKLYDYNYESTPQSDLDFITGQSDRNALAARQANIPQDNSQGYMGGVNPLGNTYDYNASQYDNDIYSHQLGDLEDIRADNQGVLDSLANSTVNFLGKTAVNVVGGLTGAVYGAGSALYNGDISKLWDNEVTTALDNASDSIGEAFRVYKSSDYNDKFILNKMISNPIMFVDEFMDTLSFTAGAVVTELLSGGLASAAVAPRAAQYFNQLFKSSKAISGLDKMSDVTKSLEGLSNANKLTTGLEKATKLTRQLATGAFWEASVEARHLADEMKSKMTNDYIEQMRASGMDIDPNNIPEDIQADIDERVKNASLATLGLNMALVGYSNISQFPSVFKTFGKSKAANNVIRQADGTYTSVLSDLSKRDVIAGKVLAGAKNPFMEGFVEEGGQSLISGTLGSFYDRKNDLEANDTTENLVKSFSNAFHDTYLTTEGLNEVLMGALVGGVGAPGRGLLSVLGKDTALGKYGFEKSVDASGNVTYTKAPMWDGGIVAGINEFDQTRAEANELANVLNESPDLVKALKNNYETQVRAATLNKRLDKAIDNNDHFEFANVKDDIFFNYANNRLENGLIEDVEARIQDLEDMSAEEFTVAFKGEDAANKDSVENMEFFKKTQIEAARNNLKHIIDARNIAEGLTSGLDLTSEHLEAAKMDITYYMSKAKMMDTREKAINDTLAKISGKKIIPANTRGNTLGEAIKSLQSTISETPTKELKNRLTIMKRMEKQFGSDLSSPFVSSIINFAETDPVAYNANKKDINLMVKDLAKITDSKNTLISLFQGLDNYRSILKYTNQLDELNQRRAEAMENSVAEAENAAASEAVLQKIDEVKQSAVSKVKKQPVVATPTVESTTPIETTEETTEEPSITDTDEDLVAEPLIVDEAVETAIPNNVDVSTGEILTPSNPLNDFDYYLNTDSGLLEKIVPVFLLKNQDYVERAKRVYEAYRSSQPNLPDVGTSDDITNYRDYYANNSHKFDNDYIPIEGEKVEEVQDAIEKVEVAPNETITEPEIIPEPEVAPEILAEENTEQTVKDELLVEAQVNNPEALRDKPFDSLALTETEGTLEPYLGMSLRNIHNVRNGNINVRNSEGKLELLDDYPKDALDPTVALPGTQVEVTLASESEYREYTGGLSNYQDVIGNPETIPLIAKQNGKFIGFILTVKGAQSSAKGLSNDIKSNLISLRSQIYANKGTTYLLNVLDKSNGVSLIMKDSQGNSIFKPIKETLSVNGKDLAEGVKIVADINGVLHAHDGTTLDVEVINPSIKSGQVFVVLPLPSGKFVKQPLRLSSVTPNDAETVYAIIKMFAANEKYAPDAKTITARNNFRSQYGVNLANIGEFYQNLKNIIFIHDKGPNQFFTKVRQEDGSYVYELRSPKGHILQINQSDMGKGSIKSQIQDFITSNFFKGFNVKMMNSNNYRHITLKNKNLVADRYDNYLDYAINNDILVSDVYGERMDSTSNKMFFTMAPFIKIDYKPVGKLDRYAAAGPLVTSPVEKVNTSDVPAAPIPTFLDGLDMDNFDINFSLLDLKNDMDDIISPDVEQEIDNLIKFCN